MVRYFIKYLFIICFVLIAILAILNPSPMEFKVFIGNPTDDIISITLRRNQNWIVYSIYELKIIIPEDPRKLIDIDNNKREYLENLEGKYIGFLSNFWKMDLYP